MIKFNEIFNKKTCFLDDKNFIKENSKISKIYQYALPICFDKMTK